MILSSMWALLAIPSNHLLLVNSLHASTVIIRFICNAMVILGFNHALDDGVYIAWSFLYILTMLDLLPYADSENTCIIARCHVTISRMWYINLLGVVYLYSPCATLYPIIYILWHVIFPHWLFNIKFTVSFGFFLLEEQINVTNPQCTVAEDGKDSVQ